MIINLKFVNQLPDDCGAVNLTEAYHCTMNSLKQHIMYKTTLVQEYGYNILQINDVDEYNQIMNIEIFDRVIIDRINAGERAELINIFKLDNGKYRYDYSKLEFK